MGYIYKITNKINGHMYIGQTMREPSKRWEHHLYSATHGSELHFHCAIRKYGWDNFTKEIIEECNDCDLNEREIYWISYYNTFSNPNHYNMTAGGNETYISNKDIVPNNKWSVKDLTTGAFYMDRADCVNSLGVPESRYHQIVDSPRTWNGHKLKRCRLIYCLEDDKVYESYKDIARDNNLSERTWKNNNYDLKNNKCCYLISNNKHYCLYNNKNWLEYELKRLEEVDMIIDLYTNKIYKDLRDVESHTSYSYSRICSEVKLNISLKNIRFVYLKDKNYVLDLLHDYNVIELNRNEIFVNRGHAIYITGLDSKYISNQLLIKRKTVSPKPNTCEYSRFMYLNDYKKILDNIE